MIFLGAGASKPFGIKTLDEMSIDLKEIMRDQGYGEIVDKIIDHLEKFGMTPDFEAIFTIVEGLTNLLQAVKNSGPFTAYVCKDLEKLKPKEDLKESLRLFRDFLYKECQLKPGYHQQIKRVYDRLFDMMRGATEKRYITGVEEGKEPSVNAGYTIVTTNYDMILESYLMTKEEPYADGFKLIQGKPQIKELDLTTYSYARQRWIVKLHGSIWQYKNDKGIFKANQAPEEIRLFPVKIQERMMIYPTGEKSILHSPYFDFYSIFKTQKWNKLIAIGYSFRDEPANVAIMEDLDKVESSTLIVINPSPEKVIQNFGGLALQKIDKRIIPVKGEFGDEKVFQQLEIALKVENKTRFYKRVVEIEGIENYWKSIDEKKLP